MSDKSILFFCIVMIVVFVYRIVLSALLLKKKTCLMDEKFYIGLFYCSLVSILVLFTEWMVVGYVLIGILPIILTLYVTFAPNRVYWIINGHEITESTFVNKFIEYDEKYADSAYRVSKVRIFRKTKESKTKIEFSSLKFDEKEALLNIVKSTIKEKELDANKREWISIVGCLLMILMLSFFIIIALFT